MQPTITYIDQQETFNEAMRPLKQAPWVGFDTEFVGEKTYIPVLCLLQVISDRQIYLVDTLIVKDLSAFLDIVQDPNILKITHAGDNDYRLLNTLFGTVPANTFDTQIAAGFVGYNYPAGFGKIVERELRISLSKSHTVTDWETRPLDKKALEYAVEDVKFLPDLYQTLLGKLKKMNRDEWAKEENVKWETPECYALDPYKEALSVEHIGQLNRREQAFMLRIYSWRRQKAKDMNVPREQVVQSRHFSAIMRMIKDNHASARANRTLPENVWRRYSDVWAALWKQDVTAEEQAAIDTIPKNKPEDPMFEWGLELLYHLVKQKCLEHEISAALLLPRNEFNKLKNNEAPDVLLQGWRKQLLGDQLTDWLLQPQGMQLSWTGDTCTISRNA